MRRFALAACVLSAGCRVIGPVGGAGGTLQSGRLVEATSDRPYRTILVSSVGRDTGSITIGTFSPRKVVVGPTSIEIDGKSVATIPESAESVTVAEEDGRLRVVADGATVF